MSATNEDDIYKDGQLDFFNYEKEVKNRENAEFQTENSDFQTENGGFTQSGKNSSSQPLTESSLKNESLDGNCRYGELFNFPENGWKDFFERETGKEYFRRLEDFLRGRSKENAVIFPPREKVFECFRLTDRNDVKVVILGQDPYHQPGQAMGLSFSVPEGVPVPPSLVNIFKEIRSDLKRDSHIKGGDLRPWAEQGVLLLNSLLTVERSKPMAHKGRGWETFTDNVIKEIGRGDVPCVFLLWGKPAASKASLIDKSKHLVLISAHPSPLSAYNGFFGCRHFSATNDFLAEMGRTPISW